MANYLSASSSQVTALADTAVPYEQLHTVTCTALHAHAWSLSSCSTEYAQKYVVTSTPELHCVQQYTVYSPHKVLEQAGHARGC